MNERLTFTEYLAFNLKRWQIVAIGVVATLAAIAVIGLVAQLGYNAASGEWWTLVAIGHIAASGLVGWYVPNPFMRAYLLRTWLEEINSRVVSLVPAKDEK